MQNTHNLTKISYSSDTKFSLLIRSLTQDVAELISEPTSSAFENGSEFIDPGPVINVLICNLTNKDCE